MAHPVLPIVFCVSLLGCAAEEAGGDNAHALLEQTSTDPSISTAGTAEAATEPQKRTYDGLTIVEWRLKMKTLDADDPASHDAIPGLMEIVQDGSLPWFTRRQAARILARIGKPAAAAVPVLIDLLDEPSPNDNSTFLWVAKSIAGFGPEAKPATEVMIGVLRDSSRPLIDRQAAIEVLGAVGIADPAGVAALIELLENREGQEADAAADRASLQELAAEAIARIGAPASVAVPALIRCLSSDRETMRQNAVIALAAMGESAAIAAPSLAEALAFDTSAAVRDQATMALAKIGPESLEILSALLSDPNPETRWRAASAAGLLAAQAKPLMRRIETVLNDEQPRVRFHAAEALWRVTGEGRQSAPIIAACLTSRERQLRMAAMELLVEMGEQAEPAIAILEELRLHERPEVRQVVRKTLAKISPEN